MKCAVIQSIRFVTEYQPLFFVRKQLSKKILKIIIKSMCANLIKK